MASCDLLQYLTRTAASCSEQILNIHHIIGSLIYGDEIVSKKFQREDLVACKCDF